MPNRKTHDCVVSTGEYKTPDGSTKKRWKNVGVAFTDDEGKISIKLETIPMPKMDNDGYPEVWIRLFTSDENPAGTGSRQPQRQQQQPSSPARRPQPAAPSQRRQDSAGGDDVPF
jgi:hypothetical protein